MPLAVFCLFLVFQEISAKGSPNATKLFDDFFLHETEYMELELRSVEPQGAHETGGRAQGGGCRCQNRRISGRGSRTVRLGGW